MLDRTGSTGRSLTLNTVRRKPSLRPTAHNLDSGSDRARVPSRSRPSRTRCPMRATQGWPLSTELRMFSRILLVWQALGILAQTGPLCPICWTSRRPLSLAKTRRPASMGLTAIWVERRWQGAATLMARSPSGVCWAACITTTASLRSSGRSGDPPRRPGWRADWTGASRSPSPGHLCPSCRQGRPSSRALSSTAHRSPSRCRRPPTGS